jgi:acetyl-CoA acetyltransferase
MEPDHIAAALAIVAILAGLAWAARAIFVEFGSQVNDLCAWHYENGRADGYKEALEDFKNDRT